jgi:type IX secretion system PorP/SprF family membrane protein
MRPGLERVRRDYKYYRMRRTLIFIFLTVSFGITVYSQQVPLLTQYMFINMAFNPGYTGSSEGINVTGLARQQWIGFKDETGASVAPQDFFITIDSPLKFLHGGVGGSIMDDKIGSFSTIQVKLDYAYRMDLGAGILGIGGEAIFQNSKLDYSNLKPVDPADPIIGSDKQTDLVIDGSIGGYYRVPDKYYIGVSALNLFQTLQKRNHYKLDRTFCLTGGYNWVIPNHPGFELQPCALIMFDKASFQGTFDAILTYNKKIWGGLGVRYQDGVAMIPVIVGFAVKSFRIGISYDIGTSGSGLNRNGSLEALINYCFKIETEKFRKSYKNTRFL